MRVHPFLAESKLTPPRAPSGTIERPCSARMLDAATGVPLTLVAAPPGFGKTTAVRVWCGQRGAAVAWVTLDGRDNDPDRLWMYVSTAVDRIREGLGRGALQRLRVAGASPEAYIDELMNGITAYGAELVIVLDDLHLVTDRDCLASIDYAVAHLPPHARIIAISRADPGLRLSRLRANGALVEIRAADLAFTAAEARELIVDRAGLSSLDAVEVDLLRERTEGWPAALVLASLWLRSVADPQRAAHEFGAGHQFVADYLSDEVFDSLAPDAREFLLQVSVLGRFTPDLCDAVLERSDSAALIALLASSNLLVIPLEHGWYHVHSLVAEFARLRLASTDPGAAARIHRRAAEWCQSQRMPADAIEHASAAGDHRLVAGILSDMQLALFRSGGARTVLRLVRALPDDVLVDHRELAVAGATSALVIGRGTIDVRRYLQIADGASATHPRERRAYVAAQTAMVRAAMVDGGVGAAVEHGRHAVELAMTGGDEALVAALGAHARALYFAGDEEEARAAATRAIEHPDIARRPPGHAFARSTLALVDADQGHLRHAREHAETAKRIVGRVGNSRTWLGANASVALGKVLMAEGRIDDAEREFAYAERFFTDDVPTMHHAWLALLLVQARCRRGRLERVRVVLDLVRAEIVALPDVGRIDALARDLECELREATARLDGGHLLATPSAAELAVLRLLPSRLSAREISDQLFLSPNTVRSHTRVLYRKLGVNSRADAVARATALGLIEPSPPE